MAAESGLLLTGVPAVHQYGEKARARILPATSASIADGDLVFLTLGRIARVGGGASASQGASLLGISNDASPTFDSYGRVKNPACTVLVGGVALLSCVSGTYQIGQPVYLTATPNQVSATAVGTAVGVVTSPFGTAMGADFYDTAVTSVYVELAHPAMPI